jgi:hypothetical protein
VKAVHPELLDKYPPPCHPGAVPDDLSSLMDEAARYAHFTMKRDGFLAPLMMAATNEGVLMFSPKRLDDESGKEQFANVVRLITGAYGATAVVLILESWMTRASREKPLDMTPPSESFDREEVITLIGQSTEDHSTRMFPIVRLGNGRFWNLGDPFDLGADSFSGRFAELLPSKEVDSSMRELGKKLLKAMGVELVLLSPS